MIKFIQRVQPPRPTIDTSTLKGKVLNRAFNNIGQDVKWSEEFHRWMFKCYHCSAWVTEEGVQADHYPTPQALGGSDELSNLVLACSSCNAANIHNAQQMLTRGKIASAGLARKYTE